MRPFVSLHMPEDGKTVCLGTSNDPRLVSEVARAVLAQLSPKLVQVVELSIPDDTAPPQNLEVISG